MGGLRQRFAVGTEPSGELARAAYVGGLSARVVCERFRMGEANLRRRAREQGWTRRAWAARPGRVQQDVSDARDARDAVEDRGGDAARGRLASRPDQLSTSARIRVPLNSYR